MTVVRRGTLLRMALLVGALVVLDLGSQVVGAESAPLRNGLAETPQSQWTSLTDQVQQQGTVNVIVALKAAVPHPTTKAEFATALSQVAQSRANLMSALTPYHAKMYAGANWVIPSVALTVDQATLNYLKTSPLVESISPDHQLQVEDAASDKQIGAPAMWSAVGGSAYSGYTGKNVDIVVMDTGIQENHPFFTTDGTQGTTRVIASQEYCSSGAGNTANSLCPGGALTATGAGAGANCTLGLPAHCEHGTHVAGIAAGNGLYSGGVGYGGVAINAGIIPMQVFSKNGTNITAYDSDVINALSQVITIVNPPDSLYIPAVVLAVGQPGSPNPTACDSINSSMKNQIDVLGSFGTVVVIPTGDDGYANGISYPACISSAVSVGAVDNKDTFAPYNQGAITTIFAPGINVQSSIPGSTYATLSGTSAAAAQVAGAVALIRQELGGTNGAAYSSIGITQIKYLLSHSGRLLTDNYNGQAASRLQVDAAGLVALPQPKSIGIYRSNHFFLRNTNTTGYADESIYFGSALTDYPIAGDWTGHFYAEIGVYDQSNGLFTLCEPPAWLGNTACWGAPANLIGQFVLGNPGDYPIEGRWGLRANYTTDGSNNVVLASYPPDGAGVFRPSNGLLYLKSQLTTGYADFTMVLGIPGDMGIAGSWIRDGQDSPGVFRPSNATFYLSNQVTNGPVYGDNQFVYGNGAGDIPVIGNWIGDGAPPINSASYQTYQTGIGIYRTSTGYFQLRDTLDSGFANNAFFYGQSSDIPVVGNWNFSNTFFVPPPALTPHAAPPTILVPRVPQSPNPPAGSVSGDNPLGD